MLRPDRLAGSFLPAIMMAVLLGCGASTATTPILTPPPPLEEVGSPVLTAVVDTSAAPTPTAAPTATLAAAVTPITVSGVSAVSYRLPLTIQHVTPTTATLFFELDAASPGLLLYAPSGQPDQQTAVALLSGQSRQQIMLEGLAPGVEYQAVVALGSGSQLAEPTFRDSTWGPVTFHTPSDDGLLRIGVFGDSGFGEQLTFDLAAQMAAQGLDFTLHTGDLVYRIYDDPGPFDAYALKWYRPLEPLLRSMPVYPVVGNHDVEEAARWNGVPFYYSAFPAFPSHAIAPSASGGLNQWYAFAYGSLQFLMLDTQVFYNESGRAEQEAWIVERLADASFKHTIVVFHVPPFSSGSVHPNDGYPVRSWVPLFEAANVPLVFSGHSHNYERLMMNGITYIISGGGSSSLYEMGEPQSGSQLYAQRTHYVLLEVFPDRLNLTATAVTGEVLDQASIPLP